MPNQTTSPVLVEVTRGPEVESRHRGQMVVMDAQGNLQHQLGDPEALVCLRSLAKPFQALAVLTSGAAEAFGFRPGGTGPVLRVPLRPEFPDLSDHLHPGAPGPETRGLAVRHPSAPA